MQHQSNVDLETGELLSDAEVVEDLLTREVLAYDNEVEPSTHRWEQARDVALLVERGWSLSKIAARWEKADGSGTYTKQHVHFVNRAWQVWGTVNYSLRPRFYDAYNSDEVRKGKDSAASAADGDEWYTPRWLFGALGLQFTLDVCAPVNPLWRTCPAEAHLTQSDDGLSVPWVGLVWCNPPYSAPEDWARQSIEHGNGLLLTHIPMNAEWAADVWESCDGLRLFQGMEFVRPDGSLQRPGYWLMLASFGAEATAALAQLEAPPEVAANPRRVPSPMWVRSGL